MEGTVRNPLEWTRAPVLKFRTSLAGDLVLRRSAPWVEKRTASHARRRFERRPVWCTRLCTEVARPTRFERVTSTFGARRLRTNGQTDGIAGASRFRRGNCLPALYTPEQIDGGPLT